MLNGDKTSEEAKTPDEVKETNINKEELSDEVGNGSYDNVVSEYDIDGHKTNYDAFNKILAANWISQYGHKSNKCNFLSPALERQLRIALISYTDFKNGYNAENQHVMERKAPDTLSVRAELSRRAERAA